MFFERETWYLGSGSSIVMGDAVRVFGAFFSADVVFEAGARVEGGMTASAFRVEEFFGLASLSGVGGSGGGVGIGSSDMGTVSDIDGSSKALSIGSLDGMSGATALSTLAVAGFFSDFSVFFFGFEAGGGGVGTLSALGLASGESVLDEWSDGRGGFESGGWALSDSVTASAAARSAALEASWGVVGGAGGASGGAVGFADCIDDFNGAMRC